MCVAGCQWVNDRTLIVVRLVSGGRMGIANGRLIALERAAALLADTLDILDEAGQVRAALHVAVAIRSLEEEMCQERDRNDD